MSTLTAYREFLKAKVALDADSGFPCTAEEVSPVLKPHQRDIVAWAVRGGRRAIFTAFGLGKTLMQIEAVRLILEKSGGTRGLIVLPLGVRQEFIRDASLLGIEVRFVRTDDEVLCPGIYLTNYESVRERKINPLAFEAVSLDEAAILRGLGGTKTFREFMRLFEGTDGYRFVATATPSPNEHLELLAYAAFLGIMDVGQAKTRFFKRNSEKADHLTLHPHKEREFWLWVASWAIFVSKPSDLGYSDEGYTLPPLDVRWHMVPSEHKEAGWDRRGQGRLMRDAAIGVVEASREKRDSLGARIAKMLEIRAEDPDAHRVIWHDLEAEREAIERAIPDALSVYGSQDLEEREKIVRGFADGEIREIAAKPVMLGSGVNFQRHCSRAIYLGIGFKFADFIQSVHRLYRFLQPGAVRIDLIYTEAESEVRAQLERKWRQHDELVATMARIVQDYGLSTAAMAGALGRTLHEGRAESTGEGWRLVNADCVEEMMGAEPESADLIVTSIPFSTQYEYSPSYNDFGHTDSNDHFWQQMDFLIPHLLRVLKPGRVAAIHVKDRIVPGGLSGFGFQTVYAFSDDCRRAFEKHGFAFLARKTIVTDVVRENAQTYRLGWSEQCKDGSRMGCGMPEYVMLFRKAPTDRSNGYADVPVVKSKEEYSRARWQLDAHGYARSSGDRLLTPEDFKGLTHKEIYRLFRRFSQNEVHDHELHVKIGEYLEELGMLPPSFMLLPPQSWHPDVWTDVARMRTLNSVQSQRNREMHLCPLQFDIVDRLIEQFSMPGETVLDPFAGLGTVPLRAISKNRRGWGVELSPVYYIEAVRHLRAAEEGLKIPRLFDLVEVDALEEDELPTGGGAAEEVA